MDHIAALRLFTHLAELGSFSAAARRSRVKQSTASKWVAALEAELDTRLVDRTTRAVRLTDAGSRFLVHAHEVLVAFDRLRGDLQDRLAEPSGRIRVSAPVVFGGRFVVPLVADFLEAHRLVQLELVLGDRYVNLVEEGFDLAVRVGVPLDTSARSRKLADGRRVLVASPKYLATRGKPRAPEDLRSHDCLVHGEKSAPNIWRFGGKQRKAVHVAVRGTFSANSSEAVLVMARRGLGVALLADWLAEEDLARGRLVPLLERFTPPAAPIHALYPAGRYASPAVRGLIEHLATNLAPRLARA